MFFPSRKVARTRSGGIRMTIQGRQYPISFVKARFICIHCLHKLISRDAGIICSANDCHYGYIKIDEANQMSQEVRFMQIGKMFPSEYLRGIDIANPTIVTIASVEEEQAMSRETNKLEPEFVMTFKETPKKLRLNITMAKECALITNDKQGNSDNWIGKRVTVYRTEIKAFGKTHIVPRLRKIEKGDKKFATNKKDIPAPAEVSSQDPAEEEALPSTPEELMAHCNDKLGTDYKSTAHLLNAIKKQSGVVDFIWPSSQDTSNNSIYGWKFAYKQVADYQETKEKADQVADDLLEPELFSEPAQQTAYSTDT